MSIHTFILDPGLELELESLVKNTGYKKSFFIQEAIKSYLEDQSDYIRGLSILKKIERNEIKTKSLEEVLRKNGLSDEGYYDKHTRI